MPEKLQDLEKELSKEKTYNEQIKSELQSAKEQLESSEKVCKRLPCLVVEWQIFFLNLWKAHVCDVAQ